MDSEMKPFKCFFTSSAFHRNEISLGDHFFFDFPVLTASSWTRTISDTDAYHEKKELPQSFS